MKRDHGRKGSQWRDRMFYNLCHRDDVCCSLCAVRARIMWRKAGSNTSIDGWPCSMVNRSNNLEIDHIIPLSEGGGNDIDNLWLLCIDCHKKKTSQERSKRLKGLFAEWREQQAVA